MKNLSYFANEITKGKNLNENIIKFGNGLATMYNGLGYIKLAMNFYTLAEMVSELGSFDNGAVSKFKNLVSLLSELIEKMVNEDSFENAEYIQTVDDIRNEIIAQMELTTGVVDCLRIYEYVLNRVEYRFDNSEFDDDYYNSRFTNDLMHYILSDKDNVVVNGKIAEVVTQLPMRLTKNSFIEHVHEAFTLYKGAYTKTVDDFIYNLSSTAMLHNLVDLQENFGNTKSILDMLTATDYKAINKAEYDNLANGLNMATADMEQISDLYLMLATVVNELYTVLLTEKAALDDIEEVEMSKKALAKIIESVKANEEPADDEMVDIFIGFEGKQEKIGMSVDSCDFAVEYVIKSCAEQAQANDMLTVYENLAKVFKLQSGSSFVSLVDEAEDVVISDDELECKFNAFVESITDSFKNNTQMINRAIMANVLGQLPVFFNSIDEIQGYINVALVQCADVAERKACVEIMKMVMENR